MVWGRGSAYLGRTGQALFADDELLQTAPADAKAAMAGAKAFREKEAPAFAGMKLKKAQTVKRQWDDGGLEKVDLKHHEFEGIPQEEQVT